MLALLPLTKLEVHADCWLGKTVTLGAEQVEVVIGVKDAGLGLNRATVQPLVRAFQAHEPAWIKGIWLLFGTSTRW